MRSDPMSPAPASRCLRVLYALANPPDLPSFDDGGLWRSMSDAIAPLHTARSVEFERLATPTETALRERLASGSWHVLHLVVHGTRDRAAAHHGWVAICGSDGRSRNITADRLATLLSQTPSLRLVVLQVCVSPASDFRTVTRALVDRGLAVLVAPALDTSAQRLFVSKTLTGILAGLGPRDLGMEVKSVLRSAPDDPRAVRIEALDEEQPLFALSAQAGGTNEVTKPNPGALRPVVLPQAAVLRPPQNHEPELMKKRKAGAFDAFLCHNAADKPAVKRVAQRLKEAGILPWLDEWELPPGQPWQPLLNHRAERSIIYTF